MSDDLKSRLRSVGGVRHDGATRWYINPDGPEAVEYIEKLEALVEQLRDDNSSLIDDFGKTFLHQESRIEKLEEALREIADGQRDADKSYAELVAEIRIEARKALEGKDD